MDTIFSIYVPNILNFIMRLENKKVIQPNLLFKIDSNRSLFLEYCKTLFFTHKYSRCFFDALLEAEIFYTPNTIC